MISEPFETYRDFMKQPAKKLKREREQRAWSQEQVAAMIGTTAPNVSRWERGITFPSLHFRQKLSELFGKSCDELGLLVPPSEERVYHSSEEGATCWMLPYHRNPLFTGRERELDMVHRLLQKEQTAVVAISGLGGIGKTETALEYTYRHARDYSAIFWIDAESIEHIVASFLDIAEFLGLPEHREANQQRIITAVQNWLATHTSWLLIWDNLEELDMLTRYLPTVRWGASLITTRWQAQGSLGQKIELLPLEQEEGMLFLLRRAKVLLAEAMSEQLKQFAEREPSQYRAARDLVTLLGGLPLALDQAGAYIEETGCNTSDYLERYKQQRGPLLSRRGASAGNHPQSVTATFRLSSQYLAREHLQAADILCMAAFVHAEAVPEELFLTGALNGQGTYAGEAADAYELDQAIATLRSLSLIQRQPETKTLSIHRLVQAVLREEMSEQEQGQWQQRMIRLLNTLFPEDFSHAWKQCERLLPHVLECIAAISDQAGNRQLAELLWKGASYLHRRAQYEQAELLCQRSLRIFEQIEGPEHPRIARLLNLLALIYTDQGKYDQAEPLYRCALRLLGREHPEAARPLSNLAVLSVEQGKYEQAESLYWQALHILEQAWGPEHPDLAHSLYGLAELYREQGRFEQARPFCLRALHVIEQAFGPDHLSLAYSLQNLALLFLEQGKYKQAEPLLQRALRIWEQAPGQEHPQVALLLTTIARLYLELGQYRRAEQCCQRALRISDQALGPQHPNKPYPLIILARLYCEQRKYKQAELLFQQALRIWEQTLGLQHPRMAPPLNGLATLYYQQGKYEEAELLYLRALAIWKQQPGPEHPETARSLLGLARLSEKRNKDAQQTILWLQRACTIFEDSLGQAHPETAKARNSYHALLERQRKSAEILIQEQPGSSQANPAQQSRFHESAGKQGLKAGDRDLSLDARGVSEHEADPLQNFLIACCELHPRAWCPASDLWQAYERWAAENHERFPLSRQAFTTHLKAHGCRADRTNAARIWRGIALGDRNRTH